MGAIIGNCTTDANPDAWFPELPQGAQTPLKIQAIADEVSRAIGLCNSCPKQEECFIEGMEPKNLAYGIWGGRLAGDRLAFADTLGLSYMVEGRTAGERVNPRSNGDNGRGVARGHVVISENDRVTAEAKQGAIRLLEKIRPYLKE